MTQISGRAVRIALAAALAVGASAAVLHDQGSLRAWAAEAPSLVAVSSAGAASTHGAAAPATPKVLPSAAAAPLPVPTDAPVTASSAGDPQDPQGATPAQAPLETAAPAPGVATADGDALEPAPLEPAPLETTPLETTPSDAAPVDAAALPAERSTTTGVPAGVVLTPMSGGTVTTTGTVANRVITGDVVFTGSNLTVRNVRVTGHAVFRGDDLVIEDSEFGSWALSGTERVRAARIDVFGNPAHDGLHVTADAGPVRDVVVADSWIHNPLIANGSHYDGIQVRGVDGLTIRNVLIDLGAYASGQNAALFLENANGGNRNVLVQGSWLLGGGYTVASYATDVQITGTVIRAGRWGYLNPTSWPLAVFSGNSADGLNGLGYDGTTVTVSSGPTIVECWPLPDAA